MKLVNLKTTSDAQCSPCPPEAYGYGLRIYLSDDQCEALGITKALAAGTQVTIQATAIVVRSSQAVEADGDDAGPDITLDLQITDMGLQPGQVLRNAAAVLYGDA